jgi:hypothetical protein
MPGMRPRQEGPADGRLFVEPSGHRARQAHSAGAAGPPGALDVAEQVDRPGVEARCAADVVEAAVHVQVEGGAGQGRGAGAASVQRPHAAAAAASNGHSHARACVPVDPQVGRSVNRW